MRNRASARRCPDQARMGDAAPVLVEISRGLDLLVLGSRARSPVRRILLGGVSSDVLHGARCPVVVIPRGSTLRWARPPSEGAGEG